MTRSVTYYEVCERIGSPFFDIMELKPKYYAAEVDIIIEHFDELPKLIDDLETYIKEQHAGAGVNDALKDGRRILIDIAQNFAHHNQLFMMGIAAKLASLVIAKERVSDAAIKVLNQFMNKTEKAYGRIKEEGARHNFMITLSGIVVNAGVYLPDGLAVTEKVHTLAKACLFTVGEKSIEDFAAIIGAAACLHRRDDSLGPLASIIDDSYLKVVKGADLKLLKYMRQTCRNDAAELLFTLIPLHACVITHFGDYPLMAEAAKNFKRHATTMQSVMRQEVPKFLWNICVGHLSEPIKQSGSQAGLARLVKLTEAKLPKNYTPIPAQLKRPGIMGLTETYISPALH